MSDSSVSEWIAQLKVGDEKAAKQIWERYFSRLCGYVRNKLNPAARRAYDEEDVALSALNALCAGATGGGFRQLENRQDLWQLLMMISARKAANVLRRPSVQKEVGECDMHSPDSQSWNLNRLADDIPMAEFADSLDLFCEELLCMLSDKLREVALLKLNGYTNEEIAKLKGRGLSTVERYLQMIREKWSSAVQQDSQEPVENLPNS